MKRLLLSLFVILVAITMQGVTFQKECDANETHQLSANIIQTANGIGASRDNPFRSVVSGYAFLNNSTDHSGILIRFVADPSTPTAVSGSTFSNSSGFYSINLTGGRYNVYFTQTGYLDAGLFNLIITLQPVELPQQTLEFVGAVSHLSGTLSGTLNANQVYVINGDISINGSLILEPGVRFYMGNDINFNVNGTLTAIGTAQNPIVFTSLPGQRRGDITINNNATQLQYCEVSKGDYGLIIASRAQVTYSKIYDNDRGISLSSGSDGCFIDHNEFLGCTQYVISTLSSGSLTTIISNNSFHDNYLNTHEESEGIISTRGTTVVDFNNNIIYNNSGVSYFIVQGWNATLLFQHNQIYDNTVSDGYLYKAVGGIYANLSFEDNIVRNNHGYGLIFLRCSGTLKRNLIYANDGYVYLFSDSNTLFVSNTIVHNNGGGLNISYLATSVVKNNIIAYNNGAEINLNSGNQQIQYNLIYDTTGSLLEGSFPLLLSMIAYNANGTMCDAYFNISQEPLFIDLAINDLALSAMSPCINAGDPNSQMDPDGSVADLGAIPYDLSTLVLELPQSYEFIMSETLLVNIAQYIAYMNIDMLTLTASGNQQVSLDINGLTVTLSAQENWHGTEQVTFTVNDGLGRAIASDTVTIRVLPWIIDLPPSFTFSEGHSIQLNFAPYITCPPDIVPVLFVEGNSNIQVTFEGLLVDMSSVNDWVGSETLVFSITPPLGRIITSDTLEVFVTHLNSPPVITSFTPEQSPLYIPSNSTGYFNIIAQDEDSEYTIGWYINGVDQQISTSFFSFQFGQSFPYFVKVVVADEEYSVEQIWEVRNQVNNDDTTQTPLKTELNRNYPNPFNPTTTVSYSIKAQGNVKVSVYDIKGHLVKVLTDGFAAAGTYSLIWGGLDVNAQSVASGIYVIKMETKDGVDVIKACLTK